VSNVPPPSSGLGSNSNYFMSNNCKNLNGVATIIDVSTNTANDTEPDEGAEDIWT